MLNFGLFWAASLVTLTLNTPKHPKTPLNTPKHPKHLNGHKVCFCENVAGLRPATFSPKNTDFFVCPAPNVFLCCFISVCLVLFSLFLLFFVPSNSFWLLRPHLHGSWYCGMLRARGEPKNGQNSLWIKTGHLWTCRSFDCEIEARRERIESGVIKSRKGKGTCYQWKEKGQCSQGDRLQFPAWEWRSCTKTDTESHYTFWATIFKNT